MEVEKVIRGQGFELEACGRLVCCAQRLCRSGSATEEAEQRINRGRRGAQAGPELEGPSGSEDGILPIPVSPSPASTSSQEDACKPPPRNCYRLVMLGSARVGKTAIVARFLSNKFEESYTPTIEDFHRKLYRIKGEVHQLDLLDTSGNHPFPAMRRLSFLTVNTGLIIFPLLSLFGYDLFLNISQDLSNVRGITYEGLLRRWVTRCYTYTTYVTSTLHNRQYDKAILPSMVQAW
ncbi:Dexamethasone-induced Ras-related protein [Apis cerana cerana]|uniref:Dexamethasone-induced Ras-related protein n=1 Tax=Apis cerana cerana TaxID=94128 RepID=A0A2A3EGB5_APICC|nr:Dexamethasone-induced Ras-related protein [Apis cerana cerana]